MFGKPVPFGLGWSAFLVGWLGLEFGSKLFFVAGIFFKFLLESLILAQDERWRRA